MTQCWITLPFSLLLFATTTFRNSIRDGMKFYHLWPRSHLMTSWKVYTNWEYVSLINSKTVLELYDMETHQKLSMPDYQKLKNDGEEMYRWETLRHDENKRAKPTPMSPPASEPPTEKNGKNNSRGRSLGGRSPLGKSARLPCREIFGILLSVKTTTRKQVLNSVINVRLYTGRLMINLAKKRKNGDKSAVAMLKDTRHLGCVFQVIEPPKSSSILRKSTKVLRPIRRVQFSNATLRHAHIRKRKGPSLGAICPAILQNGVLMHQNSRTDPWMKRRDKSEGPAETRGDQPNVS